MPAIFSAICSIAYAWMANIDDYKDSLVDIYPAMNWKNSTYALQSDASFITVGVQKKIYIIIPISFFMVDLILKM